MLLSAQPGVDPPQADHAAPGRHWWEAPAGPAPWNARAGYNVARAGLKTDATLRMRHTPVAVKAPGS
ncbi:hypothetical protein Y1Q_0018816 [Alligator mississippiensis]|uniref:Uncharacterized protein n=1 Tax=Alligator mississippiensis TaxID=8496 RepID=A0A151PJ16_ALLMI|nr:hypothetical protein Y1Q_0018816 [Alligator mississippiensis]